ncbi:MAG: serine hydrolase [Bacteroidota bacterium]
MKILNLPIKIKAGLFILALLCTGLLSAWKFTLPKNSEPYWPVSSANKEGVDQVVLDEIHADIQAGDYGLIDHFLLIRNGKIIADHSYEQDYKSIAKNYDTTNHMYNYDHPDWHPFYQGTKLHSLQSVTKSITSAALGIAIDKGHLSGVNIKIADLFKDYKFDSDDPRMMQMKLEDLLTMQAGIKWDEASYDEADNSCVLMEASEDWIQFVFDQGMDMEPGKQFEYNSGASVLIGKVIHLVTGKYADEWAEEKLFKPLGIENYYWKKTPLGEIDTEGGLYLSSHDLAKIGYLFLHKGKWEGKQIISEDWIEKSISAIIPDLSPPGDGREPGYGYQWWVPEHKGGKTKIFAGNGYGGQFVLVAPEYDMLAVFNGWHIHGNPEKFTWNVLMQKILPASKL